MSLFESAAADYARDRPGIPDEVAHLPAGRLKEDIDHPVLLDLGADIDHPVLLDRGAGTGQVPAALLPAVPHVARVDLVDVDEGMLREASTRLPRLGVSR